MPPQLAAAKVFAIPEIFEEIVLAIVRKAIATNTQFKRLEPLESLSCIRRINHASNNGILNSPTIQKYSPVTALPWMYTVTRGDRNYLRPALVALEWLLKNQFGWKGSLHVKLKNTKIELLKIALDGLDVSPGSKSRELIENFEREKNYEGASWRAVPLVGQHEVVSVALKPFKVHFRSCAVLPCGYVEQATFDGSVTLGELADWVFDVAGRSEEKHLRVLKEKQEAGLNWLEPPEDD